MADRTKELVDESKTTIKEAIKKDLGTLIDVVEALSVIVFGQEARIKTLEQEVVLLTIDISALINRINNLEGE